MASNSLCHFNQFISSIWKTNPKAGSTAGSTEHLPKALFVLNSLINFSLLLSFRIAESFFVNGTQFEPLSLKL